MSIVQSSSMTYFAKFFFFLKCIVHGNSDGSHSQSGMQSPILQPQSPVVSPSLRFTKSQTQKHPHNQHTWSKMQKKRKFGAFQSIFSQGTLNLGTKNSDRNSHSNSIGDTNRPTVRRSRLLTRPTKVTDDSNAIKLDFSRRSVLDNIVKSYLLNQHRQCRDPIAILPPFSLSGKRHECPTIKDHTKENMNIVSEAFLSLSFKIFFLSFLLLLKSK